MVELLLFLPVLVLSSFVLSALHFDDLKLILSYALENMVQLFVGALIFCVIVYLVTPG
jgi:hypothetical protein